MGQAGPRSFHKLDLRRTPPTCGRAINQTTAASVSGGAAVVKAPRDDTPLVKFARRSRASADMESSQVSAFEEFVGTGSAETDSISARAARSIDHSCGAFSRT